MVTVLTINPCPVTFLPSTNLAILDGFSNDETKLISSQFPMFTDSIMIRLGMSNARHDQVDMSNARHDQVDMSNARHDQVDMSNARHDQVGHEQCLS